MHPSDALFFEWDEGNESELADHHITASDVEEVFWQDRPLWTSNKKKRSADWKMVGQTLGGRLLTIAVLHKDRDTLRAITGWNATTGERTQYLKKRG